MFFFAKKLVYNIHDICQAGDLPNALKAIFRRFALFCLIKGQALQTVASPESKNIYSQQTAKWSPQKGSFMQILYTKTPH